MSEVEAARATDESPDVNEMSKAELKVRVEGLRESGPKDGRPSGSPAREVTAEGPEGF